MHFTLRWWEKLVIEVLYKYTQFSEWLHRKKKPKVVAPEEPQEDWRDDGGG